VSVARSTDDPILDSLTNIVGSVNVLENCRRFGVKKIVYSSSAAVYGNPDEIVVSETTPTVPASFYGVSKLTPEAYFKVFYSLYGLRYTVLRYANIYGPRQDALGEGGVISIFATRILIGQSPTIFGDGEQTRDFVYVGDIADANIRALTSGDLMTLNVGTGERTSVNQLFAIMKEITGSGINPKYAEARPGDVRHSCMDNRRIIENLNWGPGVSLQEGLANTLEFYRNI
jgi:UDP-glucose 4-epimerase